MWYVSSGVRWDPGRSHQATTRVEVWSAGSLVEADAPIISGEVKERWVTGPRSSISLTMEPSPQWDEWFALPQVELRPYAGVNWSLKSFEVPLGVFPVTEPVRTLPAQAYSVTAEDRWQWVVQNDLEYTVLGPAGVNTELAAGLMSGAGLGTVSVLVARPLFSPNLMWDKSRDQLIKDYLDPVGAEAFVTREGEAVIRDRSPSNGTDLVDGEGGTIVNLSSTRDWSKVVNLVWATSSKNDTTIDPQKAQITDYNHPAHESKIRRRVMRYSSPLISSVQDALAAANAQLAKYSAPALSWTVTCVPDPTRMPGDLVSVSTDLGTVQATVQEVTHPLGVGVQTVKLGAAL